MSAAPSEDGSLRRDIGTIGVAAIAMNGVIGSGIFALPAVAVAELGPFSPWAFAICAVLIMSVALTLARLASFFDTTGGPIVYTTTAFGPFIGFQTGWLIYLSRVAAIAASANLIVDHGAALSSALASGPIRDAAVVAYIALATLLNAAGVRTGMGVILAISAFKLIPLVLLILFGLPEVGWAAAIGGSTPGMAQLGETMLVLMYAFIGFEFSLINAGETRDAQSSIPRALIATVLGIAASYVLIQLVVVSVAPDIGTSETPLVEVARRLMGPAGAILLSLGVLFSVGGGTMTSLMTAPRLTYALARDGSLPAILGQVDQRTDVPVLSILLCGALSAVLAVGQHFVWLATLSTFIRLIAYIACIAALPFVERKLGAHAGRFALPGKLVIPLVAFLLALWLLAHSTLTTAAITLAIAVVGAPIFLACRHAAGMRKLSERTPNQKP